MHGDNSVAFAGIELIPQCGTHFVVTAARRTEPDDAERRTAAGAAADRNARNAADHVLEVGDVGLRPGGLVGERSAVGRAVQHLEGFGGIEAEIFRVAVMRDIAPRFEKTRYRDAFFE